MGTDAHGLSQINKLAYQRDWYARNKDRIAEQRKLAPVSRTPNQWAWHLKKRYGITPEQMEELFDKCGGSCHICGDSLFDSCHIDHCHTTGKVRGMLCASCNHGLGMFRDNAALLKEAARYIEPED